MLRQHNIKGLELKGGTIMKNILRKSIWLAVLYLCVK